MSNLDIVWSSTTGTTLAARLVADSLARAERKEAARKRAAEKQREKYAEQKKETENGNKTL